jgi:hypothetical protein
MFHRRHIILRHGVRDIQDEEVEVWVAIGEQTHE